MLSPTDPRVFRRAEGKGRGLVAYLLTYCTEKVERRVLTDWEVYNMPDWAYGD